MDLDLNCVASFLVLLDEKHFGRAASRLNLTTSALTKRIQRLERQVGVPLVVRGSSGGSTATDAGLRFATHARPLLATATVARQAALVDAQQQNRSLTIGTPAGPMEYLAQMNLAGVAQQVRSNYPKVRLECRQVPFSGLTSWLLEERLDLLMTVTTVRHPDIDTVPLPFTVGRMGVVHAHHDLADAAVLDVAEVADLPLIYTPAAPAEWMSPFYLADVRPRSEARLVPMDIHTTAGVAKAIGGDRATVGLEMYAYLITGDLRSLALLGAPDVVMHAAYRRSDRRGVLADFLAALRAVPPRRLVSLPATRPAATATVQV